MILVLLPLFAATAVVVVLLRFFSLAHFLDSLSSSMVERDPIHNQLFLLWQVGLVSVELKAGACALVLDEKLVPDVLEIALWILQVASEQRACPGIASDDQSTSAKFTSIEVLKSVVFG